MTYEYKIVDIKDGMNPKKPYQAQFMERLNSMGAEGWRLVSDKEIYAMIFERVNNL